MSRNIFTFSFEELPLVIEGGFEAGLVNGSAEIAYHRDGEWTICGISLDGAKRNTAPSPVFIHKPVDLDAGSPIFLMIYHVLENGKREAVNDAVLDQIAGDRQNFGDWVNDHLGSLLKHEERV